MIKVAASKFPKNFGYYRDIVQREPVAITNHDRITAYFVSSSEYDEFVRLKAMQPKTYATHELSEETIAAIAASKMDARHDYLNELLGE